MGNILELLRGVLTSDAEQNQFSADPMAYLTGRGFADLSGEDIVEGVRVARRDLSPALAAKLEPFDGTGQGLPVVEPNIGESELDAAIRVLEFAVTSARSDTRVPVQTDAAPTADIHPIEDAEAPVPAPEPSEVAEAPAPEPSEVAETAEPERIEVPAAPATSVAPDPYAKFGDELAAILRYAGEQMEAVVRRAEEEAEKILAKSVDEATAVLDQARATQEEAERKAAERIEAAEREAQAILAEAHSRRDEIREAERELRERLSGLEAVFRHLQQSPVMSDEPGGPGDPAERQERDGQETASPS